MNCFEIISLIANVCTILAFLAAFYLLMIWKKQHNYSFARDKIFEVELIYAKLLTSMEGYLVYYKDEFPFPPNRIGLDVLDITNVFLKRYRAEINEYAIKYEEALFALSILNVKYNKDLVVEAFIAKSHFEKYLEQIRSCTTKDEVLSLHQKIDLAIRMKKINGLAELQRARRSI